VLFEQGAGPALALRGVVLDARRLLLLDARRQQPLAQAHRHRMHRGLRRTGKDVARLDRPLALVAVVLGHRHIGDHAGDAHVHRGGLQRQAVEPGLVAVHEEVRAFGGCRVGVVGLRGRREHQQQRGEHRERDAQQYTAERRQRTQRKQSMQHGHGLLERCRALSAAWHAASTPRAKRVGSACVPCEAGVKPG